jgi:GNAT superfamily N-acetyltransferase
MDIPLSRAVRENFIEKSAYLAPVLPSMTTVDGGSFVAIDSGLPSDTFNVIVARDLSTPDIVLAEGVGPFMARRLPVALWYWEDPADRESMGALIDYGLTHAETHVAMAAELSQARPIASPPAGLTIRVVAGTDDLRRYGDVIADLFGDSNESRQVRIYYDQLSQHPLDRFPALHMYLGVIDEVVAATGCLFVGRDTIGIYDVVTRDEYRRRGIGAAMFAHLLGEARSLDRPMAVLQASPDGIGIYRRAGFAPVGTVHTFENRGLLA